MIKVNLQTRGAEEGKIVKCLEKLRKKFGFEYSVSSVSGNTKLEFFVRNIRARSESLRSLRHIKNLKIVSVETVRVKENGQLQHD